MSKKKFYDLRDLIDHSTQGRAIHRKIKAAEKRIEAAKKDRLILLGALRDLNENHPAFCRHCQGTGRVIRSSYQESSESYTCGHCNWHERRRAGLQ